MKNIFLTPVSNNYLKQGQKLRQEPKQRPGKKQQQGAVMITVLLLLVILTLLAISSLSTTRLEEIMAHNSQVRGEALLGAEGLAEAAVSEVIGGTILTELINGGVGATPEDIGTMPDGAGGSTASYLGESLPGRNSGYASSRTGGTLPPVMHHLNFSGTRNITAVNTTATVNIGISILGSSSSVSVTNTPAPTSTPLPPGP